MRFTERSPYNAAGDLAKVTDRNNRVREFSYDPFHRLTQERWYNGQTLARTIAYAYNDAGELVSGSDPDSAYAYQYDNLGRLTQADNSAGALAPDFMLNFSYDALSRRTGLSDSVGGAIDYDYNPLHGLTHMSMTVGSTQGPQVDFTRDLAGEVTGIQRRVAATGPTIDTDFGRDHLGRLTNITHTSAQAGQRSKFTYGYDPLNRVISYVGPEGSLTYTYDSTDQLTAVSGSRAEIYGYDLTGNRQTVGDDTYLTAPNNRLAKHGTVTFIYDSEGNRIRATDTSTGEVTHYSWDHRNRLTKVEIKNSAGTVIREARFTYDVHDRLIGRWTDADGAGPSAAVQTWTAYDVSGAPVPGRMADNVHADFNAAGAVTNRYLYGEALDEVYARMDASGDTDWYMTDRGSSVRQIVDTDGTILDAITYDSYGKILSETNPAQGDRIKFAGREWEALIDLYHNRARWYDEDDGRFASEDPIGFAGGDLNLSRYLANNPVNVVDPSGLANKTVETGVKGMRLFLEWFPHLGTGELKVITKGGQELAILKYVVNRQTGEGVCHVVATHGGKILPGIAKSRLTKVTPAIREAIDTIVQRTGGRWVQTRLAQAAAARGGSGAAAALGGRGIGIGAAAAFGAIADIFLNPNHCGGADPFSSTTIEIDPAELGLTLEQIEALRRAAETSTSHAPSMFRRHGPNPR